MVFNTVMLISAVRASAEAWQCMACLDEQQRIDGQQMLDLALCFPLQQLGRLLLYLWTFLCVPPQPFYAATSSYYDDDDDDDDDDSDDHRGSSSSTSTFHHVYYYDNRPSPHTDDDDASFFHSD